MRGAAFRRVVRETRRRSENAARVKKIEAINADLLEALLNAPQPVGKVEDWLAGYSAWFYKAREAAIAKAKP